MIFRAPSGTSVNDLPSDYQMPPLGTTNEIGKVMRQLFPEGDHHERQCCLEGDDFWLELNFGYPGDEEIRTHIGVRCNAGLGVIPVLKRVCEAFEARLLDVQTSEFADLADNARSSMMEFAAWRDRVIDKM